MKVKRCLALWLAFLFFLTLVPGVGLPVARAAGRPVITADSVTAEPGQTVGVNVAIRDNPGILGATLTISFPSQLLLLDMANGEAFSPLTMTKPGEFSSPCRIVWDGQEIAAADVKDGVILTLWFTVPAEAQGGETFEIGVSYSNGDVVDGNLNPVSVGCVSGTITVMTPASTVIAKGGITDTGLSVEVKSPWEYETAFLILASYLNEGKMLNSQVCKVSLREGKNMYYFPDTVQAENTKAFLTDESFRPLCPPILFQPERTYTVLFQDYDGSVLSEQTVSWGESALPPVSPTRSGYVFTRWEGTYTVVTADQTVTAQYQQVSDFALVVGRAWAHSGDEDTLLPVLIHNNPGVLGMTLTLSYDTDALTLKGAMNGDAVSELVMTPSGDLTSPCRFVWDGQELSPSNIRDGTLLFLTFTISPDVSEGTYPVSIAYNSGGIIDNDLSPLEALIIPGSVTIVE